VVVQHENFVPPIDGHNTTDQFIPSLHSFTGEVPISLPVFNQSIDARVIATTQQLAQEFPFNDDMSGISGQSIGVGWVQSSMSQGVRRSSSTTYLAASNSRPNLTVLINAMVMKLLPSPSTSGLKAFRTVEFTDSRSSSGSLFPHILSSYQQLINPMHLIRHVDTASSCTERGNPLCGIHRNGANSATIWNR
jgi:hypothetical protein